MSLPFGSFDYPPGTFGPSDYPAPRPLPDGDEA